MASTYFEELSNSENLWRFYEKKEAEVKMQMHMFHIKIMNLK